VRPGSRAGNPVLIVPARPPRRRALNDAPYPRRAEVIPERSGPWAGGLICNRARSLQSKRGTGMAVPHLPYQGRGAIAGLALCRLFRYE